VRLQVCPSVTIASMVRKFLDSGLCINEWRGTGRS